MQQSTLNITAHGVDVPVTLSERVKEIHRVVNLWLDAKSEFYSRIAEFAVTRRTALRVNLVTLAVLMAAIAVEQAPLWSVVSTAVASWLTYRINRKEQEGGAL